MWYILQAKNRNIGSGLDLTSKEGLKAFSDFIYSLVCFYSQWRRLYEQETEDLIQNVMLNILTAKNDQGRTPFQQCCLIYNGEEQGNIKGLIGRIVNNKDVDEIRRCVRKNKVLPQMDKDISEMKMTGSIEGFNEIDNIVFDLDKRHNEKKINAFFEEICTPREAAVMKLKKVGESAETIGKILNMTRQRVSILFNSAKEKAEEYFRIKFPKKGK